MPVHAGSGVGIWKEDKLGNPGGGRRRSDVAVITYVVITYGKTSTATPMTAKIGGI